MKKINWKLRLQNKTTLIALITLSVGFVYQLLSLFDVVPKISEDNVMTVALFIINILASFGVVVDPTTKGVTDSQQALTYHKPKG